MRIFDVSFVNLNKLLDKQSNSCRLETLQRSYDVSLMSFSSTKVTSPSIKPQQHTTKHEVSVEILVCTVRTLTVYTLSTGTVPLSIAPAAVVVTEITNIKNTVFRKSQDYVNRT